MDEKRKMSPDARGIVIAIVAVGATLGGLTTYLHSDLGGRIDKVRDDLGGRIDKVSGDLGDLRERMARVEVRLDGVDLRLDGVEHRLDGIEAALPLNPKAGEAEGLAGVALSWG